MLNISYSPTATSNRPLTIKPESGFTLLEMMITVLIIGILASIAIPSYNQYIRRSRIMEAVGQLSAHRVRMEQYFQDNRTYAGACQNNTVAPLPQATSTFTYGCDDGLLTPTVSTGTPTATSYRAYAIGTGSMTGFTYSIDQSNTRITFAVPAGWNLPATQCWALKPDGSC